MPDSSDLRRVLFVAHDFPPAGGSGPNRALAFARHLPRHGWRPIVLTPTADVAANRDERLLAEVPSDLTVLRTASFEPRPAPPPAAAAVSVAVAETPPGAADRSRPSRLRSHLGHLRRFPDAHAGWAPFAIAAGLRAVRADRPAALYTTSAPFTNHLVGLVLHRITRLPWVLEMRDGWYRWNTAIFPDYPAWRHAPERGLEGAALRSAARVVLVTRRMADAFRAQYPDLPAAHFATIPNGYDAAQYRHLPPAPPSRPDRFEVVHAGSLYHGRSIEAFLDAAGRLAAADAAFAAAFRLTLVGSLDGGARAEVARQVAHHGLGERVAYRGYLSHPDTLAAMRGADLLLALVNTTPGAEATVPGKVFEYLAVRRPLLTVAPDDAEAAEIVRGARAGWVARAHDVPSIQAALADAYRAHRSEAPYAPDGAAIAAYDRAALAGDLAAVLDAVAMRPTGGRA